MTQIKLPRNTDGSEPTLNSSTRQLTIVGGTGAGKTKFMDELRHNCGDKAYSLSALRATYPQPRDCGDTAPGSIDRQYQEATKRVSYLRDNAVSELDKLVYMLFADEFEALLTMKEEALAAEENCIQQKRKKPKATRLDRVKRLWERIFPGNKILRQHNTLMFTTEAGDDAISAGRLSQGELAVLYYIMAVLYATHGAVIFIDSPTLFIHPAAINTIWNSIEALRPDCTFVYNTVDAEFVNSRTGNITAWVKSYDASSHTWSYDLMRPGETREEMFVDLMGTRKPVLFIEGDAQHSIDARLYTLVFTDYTVRPLGSCDKVIETTRSFSTMKSMHHLDSHGIVDRDRRTPAEVAYLRKRNVMVPDVAEVENIFLAEDVIKTMAAARGKDPSKVFNKVKGKVLAEFRSHADAQALMHVRHRMKRLVECRIDGRFNCITALETHIKGLVNLLNPRREYNTVRAEFKQMLSDCDYAAVIRVFNHKPLLTDCGVAQALGFKGKDEYIAGVLEVLKQRDVCATALRDAIISLFDPPTPQPETTNTAQTPPQEKKHAGKKHSRRNADIDF